ncbi:O-antigen polysaccharide polymerase Wzy [Clostridium estertheticum]|uniref:O-antigen polysaccharide polymerase Wzy n=1 Tax=Clostridium estertheticum TaxID=238834 RepID=UPI0013EEA8D9|nr:O-antigen polysaccharide polymerase Wzy [Clostridium estertheticum]MBZ9609314.1 O-antigen polysaccharide polymerase Wzy [Clostridium estertheticum]
MIIIFLISIIFLIFIAKIKKIPIVSVYWFYILFSFLYNGVTYFNIVHNKEFYFSLDNNINLLNNQLLIAALCNVVFALVFFEFYKQIEYKDENKNVINTKKKNIFIAIYIIVFFIALYFTRKYGWNQVSHNFIKENATAYSLTAYLKYVFISMYLFYLYKYGVNKTLVLLLVLQVVIMYFDGARTTFFSIAVSTICIYNLKFSEKRLKTLLIGIISLFLIVSARSIIMKGTFKENFAGSINIEAQVGSYMVRQSLHIEDSNPSYTYGKTYIVDPVIYFIDPITRPFLKKPLRSYLYFDKWQKDNSIYLSEAYAPMGGFYYIAEAVTTFPYVGAEIITFIYAMLCVYMENNKNKRRGQYILYLALAPLFIKSTFSNFFTISCVMIILFYVWNFIDNKFIQKNAF